jgi:uncharacterized membrane protein YjdF
MNGPALQCLKEPAKSASYLRRIVVVSLQALMLVELVVILSKGQWLMAFLVTMIMAITIAPIVFSKRLPVNIPPEFQAIGIIFVFAAIFLGEIRDFYLRIWWWDIALHATASLLLGIFGFLLVYVLNENNNVRVYLHERFVALFAFVFSLSVGALWEIFEFGMDHIFGTDMQKPMLGDPSGLTDTMFDLMVDLLGAATISLLGWWYMKRRKCSFFDSWIQDFIEKNPRFFPDKNGE